MARQRFDTAPQFNVSEDSVVIQQVAGSTAPLLELKNHTGTSLMTVSNTGQMTTSVTPSFTDISISGNATIGGNLTVSGNTITFDTETVVIEDKNIVLGNNAIASNSTADGGGITIAAGISGNKTFNFVNFTSSWTSSEHIDLAANKSYKVNNVDVMCPVGMVVPYAGNTAPSGWLLCSNVAVSRTTYSALFAVIGTTYGSGDGVTTFNLPDLRGRVVAGTDNMGGFTAGRISNSNSGITGTTLGAAGGSELLHQHQHNNSLSNATVSSDGHTHNYILGSTQRTSDGASGPFAGWWISSNINTTSVPVYGMAFPAYDTVKIFYYPTGSPSGTQTVTISNASSGSGSSQNVQPTIVLNYIIKV